MPKIGVPLPYPKPSYDHSDQLTMRRQVEQNVEDIYSEIEKVATNVDSPSSLALRRFQFMMMGASSG